MLSFGRKVCSSMDILSIIFLCYAVCGQIENVTDLKRIAVDVGFNISLPCKLPDLDMLNILWIKDGKNEQSVTHLKVLNDGSLFLYGVTNNDSGIYTCLLDSNNAAINGSKFSIRLQVRTPPPKLKKITIHVSTILALVLWDVNATGGYPIIDFTAEYRLADSFGEWKPISPNHISPTARQVEVYKLTPNTTYTFRIWATNFLGQGEISEVNATTLRTINEEELAQYLLPKNGTLSVNVIIAAVTIVMSTLSILSVGVCCLIYVETKYSFENGRDGYDEQESIELVPNIILNPGFDDYSSKKWRQTNRKFRTNYRSF